MKDWLTILQQAVDATSMGVVATKLGYNNHTTISLVLSGKYPAKTDTIAAKVLDVYARLTCPHSGAEITYAECRALSTSSVPTSSPQAMRHWRACQSCANKGVKP